MFARGLVFGRSETSRKNLREKKYLSKKGGKGANFNELSLLQMVQWIPLKAKNLFLNTTADDFKTLYGAQHEPLATSNDVGSVYRSLEVGLCSFPCDEQLSQEKNTDLELIRYQGDMWGAYNDFNFADDLGSFTNSFFDHTSYFSLGSTLSCFSFGYDSTDYNLFDYFVKKICPVCICSSNDGISGISNSMSPQIDKVNPYLKFIVPLGMKSQLLFMTIVAVAANELNIVHHRKFYEDLAHNYMSCVLKELPGLINSRKLANSNDWDEILATLLMLCFADISTKCGRMWILYLDRAKEFVRYLIDSQVEGELSTFVARYFVSHDIMGQTAWTDLLVHRWDPFFEDLKYDFDTNIDLFLGCSPYLITLINNITLLGARIESLDFGSKHTRDTIQPALSEQRNRLDFELINLEQKLAIEDATESAQYVQLIAKVKKLAAIIYLFVRVDQELYFKLGKSYQKQYKLRLQNVRSRILEAVSLMKQMNTSSMSLLWPLFIVGVVSDTDEDHRHFVLQKLQDMEKSRRLASVRMAKHTIEALWKEKDLGCLLLRWRDMMGGRADTISLA